MKSSTQKSYSAFGELEDEQEIPTGFALGRDPSVGKSAWFPRNYLEDKEISDEFKQFLQRDQELLVMGKNNSFSISIRLSPPKIIMDTEVAAYLLNPSRNSYLLNDLCRNMQSYLFR